MPISLKSSVNLFLNHQNIITSGTFPRIVFVPNPVQFPHVCTFCGEWPNANFSSGAVWMLQGELSLLVD